MGGFASEPSHGENDEVCVDFKDMESKLKVVPWRLETIRTGDQC